MYLCLLWSLTTSWINCKSDKFQYLQEKNQISGLRGVILTSIKNTQNVPTNFKFVKGCGFSKCFT